MNPTRTCPPCDGGCNERQGRGHCPAEVTARPVQLRRSRVFRDDTAEQRPVGGTGVVFAVLIVVVCASPILVPALVHFASRWLP
jgi:hypothetical protein